MIRSGSRVERPIAPQSQPSAEDTPTGEGTRNGPHLRRQFANATCARRKARKFQAPTSKLRRNRNILTTVSTA